MRKLLGLLLCAGLLVHSADAQVPVVGTQPTFSVAVTPTLTATTYSSGQSEGGLIALSNFVRPRGPGTGSLINITLKDYSGITGAVTALLFSGKPSAASTIADTSTVALTKADTQAFLLGAFVLSCSVPTGIGSSVPSLCTSGNLAFPFRIAGATCPQGRDQCFTAYLVLMAGASRVQGTTSDITVSLSGIQD